MLYVGTSKKLSEKVERYTNTVNICTELESVMDTRTGRISLCLGNYFCNCHRYANLINLWVQPDLLFVVFTVRQSWLQTFLEKYEV